MHDALWHQRAVEYNVIGDFRGAKVRTPDDEQAEPGQDRGKGPNNDGLTAEGLPQADTE